MYNQTVLSFINKSQKQHFIQQMQNNNPTLWIKNDYSNLHSNFICQMYTIVYSLNTLYTINDRVDWLPLGTHNNDWVDWLPLSS